jgi:hypothetical protein
LSFRPRESALSKIEVEERLRDHPEKGGASAVIIRFDGRKQPVTLHLSYIEMQ